MLILCPIPAEFTACREILLLRDSALIAGYRGGKANFGNLEVYAIETGPAKVRSACGAMAGCLSLKPDLVIDSGSCAGIDPGSVIGEIILADHCYEFDISGTGIPKKAIPEMKIPSGFSLLKAQERGLFFQKAIERGRLSGYSVRLGPQACGEFMIQSVQVRNALHHIFRCVGSNWESASVFAAALKNRLPALSLRVTTDLGNSQALADFRRNVKKRARELYRYLQILIETGWFDRLVERWQALDGDAKDRLPSMVLP